MAAPSLRARPLAGLLCLVLLVLSWPLAGCSILKAVTNPGGMWALNEPATLSVVLRRAESAEKTADEVDRLLVATPLDKSGKWPETVPMTADDAKGLLEEASKRFPYDKMPFRVMVAEAWRRRLSGIQKVQALPRGDARSKDDKKDDGKGKDAKGKDDGKGKDAKGKDEKGKDAKKDQPKGRDEKGKDAKKDEPKGKDEKGKDDKKDTKKDKAPPTNNLLSNIAPELGQGYAKITAKQAEIADLQAELAALEAERGKLKSDADKKESEKKGEELDKQIDAAKAEVTPLMDQFLADVRKNAKSAPSAARDKIGPAVAAMLEAVKAAQAAASAAVLRYPLALPGLTSDVQSAVPNLAADVIEEQTGHRPLMQGLTPDVRLDGTDVELTLNGLSKEDLGRISMSDLVSETTVRTKGYVVHVVTLVPTIESLQDRLTFQQKTLQGILDGFVDAGSKLPDVPKIEDLVPEGAAQPAKK